MKSINVIALAIIAFAFTGCTESELNAAYENPSFFEAHADDGPKVREYKKISKESYVQAGKNLTSPRSKQIFYENVAEKTLADINILRMLDDGVISEREARIMMHNSDQRGALNSELRSLERRMN